MTNTKNNSATACLSLCSQYGYPVGGMEYGDECCMFLFEPNITHSSANGENQIAETPWMSLMRNPQNSPIPYATCLARGTLDTSAVQAVSLAYTGGLARRCIHGIRLRVMLLARTNC